MKQSLWGALCCVLLLFLLPPVSAGASRQQSEALDRLVVVATGDLMVHTPQLRDAAGTGFTRCFSPVAGDLREGDITIGNLETVLAGHQAGYSGEYPRFNTPDSFAAALAESGYTFLSTANNHCLDQGEPGLLRTLQVLDAAGLGHTGTFADNSASGRISLVEAGGFRVALVAYTYGVNGNALPAAHLVNLLEEERIARDLQQAQELRPDLIIALPHMGEEYGELPSADSSRLSDWILRCGADVVLGSHSHMLQPVQIRDITDRYGNTRTTLVAHSLGNFISSQTREGCDTGMVLKLDFVKEGDDTVLDTVRMVPTLVQRREGTAQVYPLGELSPAGLSTDELERVSLARGRITRLFRLGESASSAGMRREYTIYSRHP